MSTLRLAVLAEYREVWQTSRWTELSQQSCAMRADARKKLAPKNAGCVYATTACNNNNRACLSAISVKTGSWSCHVTYSVSQKKNPCGLRFSDIFSEMVESFRSIFTHLLHVPIYSRLQIFIPLSPTLTKLCHIKRDYLVHIICTKCPPSAETHAFRCLRKSLIALLVVVCGKSTQICCFYNVNKHVGYDMT